MGGDELNMEVLRDKGTEEGGSDDALEGDADAVVAWLDEPLPELDPVALELSERELGVGPTLLVTTLTLTLSVSVSENEADSGLLTLRLRLGAERDTEGGEGDVEGSESDVEGTERDVDGSESEVEGTENVENENGALYDENERGNVGAENENEDEDKDAGVESGEDTDGGVYDEDGGSEDEGAGDEEYVDDG